MANTGKNEHMLDSSMTLGDHLEELRMRVIYALMGLGAGLVAGFFLAKPIISWLQSPYLRVLPEATLQALSPSEGFLSYIKVAFITGLIITSPWVFYQIWMFIAAGLYPHEKKYVHLAVPFSAGLFIAGALFFITMIAPLTLRFLVVTNQWLNLASNFTFKEYISFISRLMLVFGVAFQTPTAIFFLNRLGIVSLAKLRSSRKFVILAFVILSAMATPPDVVSQIALAGPLYALYELGILISQIAEKRRKKQEQEDEIDRK